MSMLEAFFFQFKGDTHDAEQALGRTEKKAHDAKGALKELFTQGAAMIGGFFAIEHVAEKTFEAAEAMNKTQLAAERLGVETGKLDVMSRVMEDAGGSAEGFQDSLRSLQINMEMFRVKGTSRAHDFFKSMGIDESSAKNAMDLLEPLHKAFQKLSKGEQQGQGAKLGLDPATIWVLGQSNEEYEKLIANEKEFGQISAEDSKELEGFHHAMIDIGRSMMMLWRGLAIAVIPALTVFADALKETMFFMRDHAKFVVGLGMAYSIFLGVKAVQACYAFAKGLTAVRAMALMAAAAEYLALLPAILLAAAWIAAAIIFAMLVEDIHAWMNGQPSAIGKMLGSWTHFKEQMVKLFHDIGKVWDKIIAKIMKGAKIVMRFIHHPVDATKEGVEYLKKNRETFDKNQAVGQTQQADQNNFNAQSGNMPANLAPKTTNVTTGDIIVNTKASSPDGVGEAVDAALKKHIDSAIGESDDGVTR